MSADPTTATGATDTASPPDLVVGDDGRGEAVVLGDLDLRELVRLERALELLDLARAEDAVEEHLGQDVVGWELCCPLITAKRSQNARTIGTRRCEYGTRYRG